jgi:hypothetical protein
MRLALLLVPVALLLGGCGSSPAPFRPAVKAPPQRARLDWVERYPEGKAALVFGVKSLGVTKTGWYADISVENRSDVGWEVGAPRFSLERAFGVLLFATGKIDELERRNMNGTLPAIRNATRYVPALPVVLEPRQKWSGRISAPGPLAGGLWVRVSFGTFTSIGDPPPGAESRVVWFTDHAHRLQKR